MSSTIYLTRRPVWPLCEFVEALWYCEIYDVPHKKERLLPSGALEIVINLYEDRLEGMPAAVIAGMRSVYDVIDTASLRRLVGIHFKPGGTRPFLHAPSGEFANLDVPARDVFGMRSAARLRERLLEADSTEAIFRVLEDVLLERGASRMTQTPAVRYALERFGRIPNTDTIAVVADACGFTAKRFIQAFRDEVGLTPKAYCRVRRFQGAVHQIYRGDEIEWPQVALEAGYYDQAHFIHDFKAFSGLNPTQYLARRGMWANHVPLVD